MRLASGLGCATLSLALGACAGFAPQDFATFAGEQTAAAATSWHGLPIRSGQIVVSEQGTAVSLFITLMSEDYSPYVHAGLIVIDDGRPYVYEAVGQVKPRFAGPPTDWIAGHIRRVSLERYLHRHRIIAIYEPPPAVDREALARFARQHRGRTEFDPYFDAGDDERYYCTEFVARALEASGGPRLHGSAIRDNRSLRVALDWLKIQAPDIVLGEALVRDASRVALISRRLSQPEIATALELKRELHARFTDDQRLGNVFRWSGTRPKLRDGVAAFVREAMQLAERVAPAQIDGAVDTLARRWLGEADELLGPRLACANGEACASP